MLDAGCWLLLLDVGQRRQHTDNRQTTQTVMKRHITIALMAAASFLTAQQLIWNLGIIVAHDTPQHVSLVMGQSDIMGDKHKSSFAKKQQLGYEDRKQKMHNTINKPTNIYVLGERNSGTNYVSKGS